MEFKGSTNQKHRVQCESSINHVTWGSTYASEGDSIKLDIGTSFMGRGSEVNLIFKDQRGRTLLEMTKPVYADRVTTTIDIPGKIKTHLVCEVRLSTNGKILQSAPLIIVPPRSIHKLNWSQTSVKRGDIVTLSAQVMGFIAGTKAIIHIYEYDEQGAHEPVARLSTVIVDNKIEVMWQFRYPGNTYDIPTEAERTKQNAHYQAPSYFWVAEVDGLRYGLNQNSGLLTFNSDELNITLRGYDGLYENDYVITLADGKQVKGNLKSDGNITLTSIAPGPVEIVMANLVSANPQPLTEIMPKGSLPLPSEIPNFQTEAANEFSFTKGWGWRRFALMARSASLALLADVLLTSGDTRKRRWQTSEYEFIYFLDSNILSINKPGEVGVQLLIQNNDIIEIVGETSDLKLILGATVGFVNAQGLVATIIAAMNDNDFLKWRIYKANGGEDTFQVWGYSGKPLDVEVKYPVGVPNTKCVRGFGPGTANPNEINFTQPGVNRNVNQYVDDMVNNKWDWEKSGPLRVMEVDGKLVSYDNRRLYAAQSAGIKEVPIEVVNPMDFMPGSKKTWQQAFDKRRNMKINLVNGKPVPPTGLVNKPRINP